MGRGIKIFEKKELNYALATHALARGFLSVRSLKRFKNLGLVLWERPARN
jgi:hypothetical protein